MTENVFMTRLAGALRAVPGPVLSWLPRGKTLSDDAWAKRHRWMTLLLAGQAAALLLFSLAQGYGLWHSFLDAAAPGVFAVVAVLPTQSRAIRSGATALGLLVCSAVLVHLSGGATEAHFHFFVMIAVLTLYEDWSPFLLAIAFVLFHHGIVGTLVPDSVFEHTDEASTWQWALIHAAFVAAAGAANVLAWRLHEDTRTDLRRIAAIVESSDDAIFSLDIDGTPTSWNDGARNLFGWDASEIIGHSVAVLFPPEGRNERQRLLQRVIAGETLHGIELDTLHKSGQQMVVRMVASPLRDSGGDINGVSAILHDVTDRTLAEQAARESRRELEHQAMHDTLTGLPNRALLHDRLEHSLNRTRRTGAALAVLFVDVDRFKVINDSLGHAAGDQLLEQVAMRISSVVRASDTVARFGGDEFAVLCEDMAGEQDAITFAGRIVAEFERPLRLDGREHFVSTSVGVTTGSAASTADSLLRDADAAMYRAKERGGGRYELFDSEMRERSLAKMEVENDLRRALTNDELRLFFQPVVDLPAGNVTGAEALIRWEHPTRGLLAPGQFIPIAEESTLIAAIGDWVLRAACRQLAVWGDDLPGDFALAINFSARQFADPHIIETVQGALADAGVEPRRLSLELTESVLMHQEGAAETLAGLRALGVKLVLDDFGTGYSSLSYLSRFPLDGLKVDRSFIARMDTGSPEHAIVAAVSTMAEAMNLSVVAEGVETLEQRTALGGLGYRLAQGYLFAKPMPAESFTEALLAPAAA